MISFSTCWNSHRHTCGRTMVHEIRDMGFDTIEVSHGLKITLLPGIQRAFQAGEIRISGIHNFCPSPVEVMIDAPDAYEFTSHREYERKRAVELTLRSLETAAQFGAAYLVMHMGTVPMKKTTTKLEELVLAGKLHSRAYVRAKHESLDSRAKIAALYVRRAEDALEEIAPRAAELGVKLAIESRSHFEQVPSEPEMSSFMEKYAAHPAVGYWHDIGHVQRKANLGYLDHYEWLSQMQPHLIGCHLHDVTWPHGDHRVPLMAGGIDYDLLMPLISPEKPVVWELSPSRRKKQIIEALGLWKEKFGY